MQGFGEDEGACGGGDAIGEGLAEFFAEAPSEDDTVEAEECDDARDGDSEHVGGFVDDTAGEVVVVVVGLGDIGGGEGVFFVELFEE